MKKDRKAGAPSTGGQNSGRQENEAPDTQQEQVEAVRDAAADVIDETVAAESDACQELKKVLAARENDFADLSNKYLRLMAEFDNYRKRSQKEKEALYDECISQVVKEWLPVIDNLDRAEQAARQYESDETGKIAAGIEMIQKQVEAVLERLGVTPITCSGETFDPNLHDAVMHIEDQSVGPSVIVEELQKGYRRQDRVIRHSVVKVAN